MLRDSGRALLAERPVALQLFENITGRDAHTLPKFECAQQALAYLNLSLEPERIAVCFAAATDDERLKKARTRCESSNGRRSFRTNTTWCSRSSN